jgi:hypothetical protein
LIVLLLVGLSRGQSFLVDGDIQNISEKYSWTNANEAWQSTTSLGIVAAFYGNTSFEHQPSVCFLHAGTPIIEYGALHNGIQYVRLPGMYAGYLVAWHTPSGFVLDSGPNREALVKPYDSDWCVTYWLISARLEDLAALANRQLSLLPISINRLCKNPVPSEFVSYAWFDGNRLDMAVDATDYSKTIEINTIDWDGEVVSRRNLTLPLEGLMWLPMKDIDKTVVYFGDTKIYAERR